MSEQQKKGVNKADKRFFFSGGRGMVDKRGQEDVVGCKLISECLSHDRALSK